MKRGQNKKAPRITAALMALLLASTMFACASDPDSGKDSQTTAAETTAAPESVSSDETARLIPVLPEDNYDGYTFTVLHWNRTDWPTRACIDIYAAEETGDAINDAVYRRNMTVMDKYNFEIELLKESPANLTNMVKKTVQNGEDAYDLVINRVIENYALLQTGFYLDLNTVPNMDLTAPWYDQSARESLTINGRLYFVASDLTIEDNNATAAIAFNKQLATDNGLPDLYGLVREGKWTLETMADLYKPVANDLNGDDKMNENDLYGFLGGKDFGISMFFGGGGSFIKTTSDGGLVPTLLDGNNTSMIETIYNLEVDAGTFYHHHVMGSDDTKYEALFANGHGLFFWMRLDNVMSLRTSETNFGILPTPKYDENQENYLSNVSPWTCGLLTIPSTAKEPARTGLIIEALSAESKYTVQPAYFETTIKYKATRDEDSLEMLDIIVSNRVFDIAEFYRVGSLSDIILEMGSSASFNVASKYEKLSKQTSKAIDKLLENLEKAAG